MPTFSSSSRRSTFGSKSIGPSSNSRTTKPVSTSSKANLVSSLFSMKNPAYHLERTSHSFRSYTPNSTNRQTRIPSRNQGSVAPHSPSPTMLSTSPTNPKASSKRTATLSPTNTSHFYRLPETRSSRRFWTRPWPRAESQTVLQYHLHRLHRQRAAQARQTSGRLSFQIPVEHR